MKPNRWRWLVIAAALIAAVVVPLLLISGSSDDDDATPGTGTATSPVLDREAVVENDPGVKITDEGSVSVGGVRTSRPSEEAVVISYRTSAPVRASVAVLDPEGKVVGRATGERPEGESVEVVSLAAADEGALRLVLAVVPTAGGEPTVATVAVPRIGSTVRVLSPTPGSTIAGSTVVVRLRTRSFDISNQGESVKARQGHVHLTLDGRTYIVVYGTTFTFRGVPAGEHTLVVTPARNDHMPAAGVEESTIAFTTSR